MIFKRQCVSIMLTMRICIILVRINNLKDIKQNNNKRELKEWADIL